MSQISVYVDVPVQTNEDDGEHLNKTRLTGLSVRLGDELARLFPRAANPRNMMQHSILGMRYKCGDGFESLFPRQKTSSQGPNQTLGGT